MAWVKDKFVGRIIPAYSQCQITVAFLSYDCRSSQQASRLVHAEVALHLAKQLYWSSLPQQSLNNSERFQPSLIVG